MTLSIGATYARALLRQLNLDHVSDIRALAGKLQLGITEVEAEAFDGALLRPSGVPVGEIALRSSIREIGRKNFTIAHEIGHFLLPGHENSDSVCTSGDIDKWWSKEARSYELEANEFAAELLIPTGFARQLISKTEPNLDSISALAETCKTSLTATAWRYCDLTSFRCAVIWAKAGIMQWYKRSAEFGYHLRMKSELPQDTLSSTLYREKAREIEIQRVDAGRWLESENLLEGATIWEQAKFVKSYDSIVTLLWIRERVERYSESDEEQEEPLDPTEFTIHRKKWPDKRNRH